jgi:hypothetical protein
MGGISTPEVGGITTPMGGISTPENAQTLCLCGFPACLKVFVLLLKNNNREGELKRADAHQVGFVVVLFRR